MESSPNILITGATGFIGRHLVPDLVKLYPKVAALVRKGSDVAFLKQLGVELRYGELTDLRSLEGIADGVEIVLHLAALMSDKDYLSYDDFYKVNVLGTQNLLLVSSSKIKQFIFISTVGVLGGTTIEGVDESVPYGSSLSSYERSKAEAERVVFDLCRKNKINLTILRIGQLYGPGMKYGWPEVLKSIEDSRMFIAGSGNKFLQLTYVRDAINGILLSIGNDKAYGEVINICSGKAYRIKDFFSALAVKLEAPNPKILPFFLVYCAALILEIIPRKMKPDRLKYLDRHRLSFFQFNHVYSIKKARELLGYSPEVGLSEGVSRLVSWYKKGKGGG